MKNIDIMFYIFVVPRKEGISPTFMKIESRPFFYCFQVQYTTFLGLFL